MPRRGRPLRFLGVLAISWIAARVVMVWPQPEAANHTPESIIHVAQAARRHIPQRASAPPRPPFASPRAKRAVAEVAQVHHGSGRSILHDESRRPSPQPVDRQRVPAPAALLPSMPRFEPTSVPGSRGPSRWSGSAWIVARGGAGLAPGAFGGQLGGSQAGMRLVYALDVRRRVALVGRVTSPLGSGLREASLGIEWQPSKLPVRIVAEQRFALAGGQGGPGLGAIGGIGPVEITHDVRLEAYAQAGIIRRAATEPYVDGAVRVTHPVAQLGALRFDLGAGAWGGAQRGATRLDIGPSLGVALPLGGQPVRLALDWRERVAGGARPGSGPALTLGTDF